MDQHSSLSSFLQDIVLMDDRKLLHKDLEPSFSSTKAFKLDSPLARLVWSTEAGVRDSLNRLHSVLVVSVIPVTC